MDYALKLPDPPKKGTLKWWDSRFKRLGVIVPEDRLASITLAPYAQMEHFHDLRGFIGKWIHELEGASVTFTGDSDAYYIPESVEEHSLFEALKGHESELYHVWEVIKDKVKVHNRGIEELLAISAELAEDCFASIPSLKPYEAKWAICNIIRVVEREGKARPLEFKDDEVRMGGYRL
ncbi:MAG: hypothetical protein ACE5JL_11905, partial [Dehalococcoidia bacterium]